MIYVWLMITCIALNGDYVAAKRKAIVSPVVNPLPDMESEWSDGEINYGMHQGDIDLGEDSDASASNRNALRDESKKWENGHVCYFFEEGSGENNPNLFSWLDYVTDTISNVSCLTFQKMSSPTMGCIMVSDLRSGCSSALGHRSLPEGKYQRMQVGKRCGKGAAVHEMLHAVGFKHEQSRPDRDEYVKIFFDRIQEGRAGNFKKATYEKVTTLDEPYDYGSLMHYGARAFSNNGQDTIEAIPDSSIKVGQRKGMSELDVKKLNKYYNCGHEKRSANWNALRMQPPSECDYSGGANQRTDWCDHYMPHYGEYICAHAIYAAHCKRSCYTIKCPGGASAE